jgi:spore germination protein KB
MDLPWSVFIQAVHASASFIFGETIALLMIIPFVNKNEEVNASFVKAIIFIGILVTLLSARTIAILGPIISLQTYPTYTLTRLINIADIITRVEILFAVSVFSAGFIKISVFYYTVILGIGQMCNLRNHTPLIAPVGILMLTLSLLQFSSSADNVTFASQSYPYYSLPFQFILPLVTLGVAVVRKLFLPVAGGENS